jgi:glyoxalase superfamily protein
MQAMALLADIVIDCAAPAALARFWSAALDGYEVAPYDEEELARLRAQGIDDPEDDPTVLVQAAAGPRLWLVRVPEAKAVKNRVHVDLRADDASAERDRLITLGATVAPDQHDDGLVVLLDPEGNEFCLLKS